MGILICGLNGAGKSTLGKALAETLHYKFIDVEDLYFAKLDPDYPYANPRTREEVEGLLAEEIKATNRFVFAAVKGDFREVVDSSLQSIILLEVPSDIRFERVKQRSYQKFGKRILPGGDLYEHEMSFFAFVESRDENLVEEWLGTTNCPVIRVDGTESVEANVREIIKQLS